jgi:hypothetical protein
LPLVAAGKKRSEQSATFEVTFLFDKAFEIYAFYNAAYVTEIRHPANSHLHTSPSLARLLKSRGHGGER